MPQPLLNVTNFSGKTQSAAARGEGLHSTCHREAASLFGHTVSQTNEQARALTDEGHLVAGQSVRCAGGVGAGPIV